LTAKKVGNQNHFQANPNNPIFSELKSMVKKTFGVIGVLKNSLQELLPNIEYAFVYGSIAKGNEHGHSDLDLMIVAEDLSYTKLMDELQTAEDQLHRKINPTMYSYNELFERINKKQSFITRVLAQDLLWLKGESQFSNLMQGK
jgi:predicted nucleotidyltransferase